MIKSKLLVALFVFCVLGTASVASASQIEGWTKIAAGWNLLYGFIPGTHQENPFFETNHIKAVYAFLPSIQKYARVYPDPENEKFESDPSNYMEDTSFLVYSDISAETEYSLQEPMPIEFVDEHTLYAGYNFFGITPALKNRELNDVRGTCNIEKAFLWNATLQSWSTMPLTEPLEAHNEIPGLVIKVSKDCALGLVTRSNLPTPPQIP